MAMQSLTAVLRGRNYFWIGAGLLVLFVIQQATGLRFTELALLQNDSLYKQLTGFTLASFISYQWYFSLLRIQKQFPKAARHAGLHKQLGVLAPLLFFLHAQELGYAYQLILSLAFFAVFVTGLFNPESINAFRSSRFRQVWVVTHIGVATLLPFMLVYHVCISYWFE